MAAMNIVSLLGFPMCGPAPESAGPSPISPDDDSFAPAFPNFLVDEGTWPDNGRGS